MTSELVDAREIMNRLGVKRGAAETIMRQLPRVEIPGLRRWYVWWSDVEELLTVNTRKAP